MSLAKKTLKPKSSQYEDLKVPTWAEWEEINKTLNELDATKSVKKATPPKGKLSGRASKSEKDYETPDIYKHNKENYGAKYSSKVKKNSPPTGKGYGKVNVADDYKKKVYEGLKNTLRYIDEQYELSKLVESDEDKKDNFGSDAKELKGDQGNMDFDFESDGEESENEEKSSNKFTLKVSKDYIEKLLSDKPSKVKVDTIEVSENSDDTSSSEKNLFSDNKEDTLSKDSFFDNKEKKSNKTPSSSLDDLFNDDKLAESLIYEAEEEEENTEEDNKGEFNFDFDKELNNDIDKEDEDTSNSNVVQKFDVSFETKNLTKSDQGETKNITIEIVEVDSEDSIYKAVLKDDNLELESESKKCTSSSNVESLVKEVINKFFNSSSEEVTEGRRMKSSYKKIEEEEELENDLEEDRDYFQENEEPEIVYYLDEDEDVEYEDDEEIEFEDDGDIEYEDDEDFEEYEDDGEIEYEDDEDFEEYEDEEDFEEENLLKTENKFLELANKIGLSKENTKKLYNLFLESVNKSVAKSKNSLYKKAIDKVSRDLDKYLNYVIENWVKDNKVAIVENIEFRKMKRLMNNMMDVLAESNIIVDKKEIKLAPIYEGKIRQLKNENKKLLNENINLKQREKEIKENLTKASIFLEETAGLSELSKNKIRNILASTNYVSESQYRNKIRQIKKEVLIENKPVPKQKLEPLPKKEVVMENIEYPGTTNVSVNNNDIKNVISLSKMLDNFAPKY